MKNIILNSDLAKVIPNKEIIPNPDNLVNTLSSKFGKQPDDSTFKYLGGLKDPSSVENYQKGFVGMLSHAYNNHEKIEIGPHDIWFIVLTEIALIIKNNVEICRPLFSKSKEQISISVPTDDPTQIDLSLVIEQLQNLIPMQLNVFVPELSTHTNESLIACYAALCDGVSPYYSYSTFCCGIPEVKVTGTKEDWNALLVSTSDIASAFFGIGLPSAVEYMIRVGDIIDNILHSLFVQDNDDFWKNIFTQKNVGSGGELEIDGWISELFFVSHPSKKLQNFLSNLALVDYENLITGRKFKTAYGPFNRIRTEEDFLKSEYGSAVFEKVEKSRIVLIN